MIELTRCGAPDNDRYLPAVMTQGDASTYQTMIDNSTMQTRSQQMVGRRLLAPRRAAQRRTASSRAWRPARCREERRRPRPTL